MNIASALPGIILVVFVIVSLFLIFLVLIQEDNSGGIGSMLTGGGSGGQAFKSPLVRPTAFFCVLFLLLSLGMIFVNRSVDDSNEVVGAVRQQNSTAEEWWKEE